MLPHGLCCIGIRFGSHTATRRPFCVGAPGRWIERPVGGLKLRTPRVAAASRSRSRCSRVADLAGMDSVHCFLSAVMKNCGLGRIHRPTIGHTHIYNTSHRCSTLCTHIHPPLALVRKAHQSHALVLAGTLGRHGGDTPPAGEREILFPHPPSPRGTPQREAALGVETCSLGRKGLVWRICRHPLTAHHIVSLVSQRRGRRVHPSNASHHAHTL